MTMAATINALGNDTLPCLCFHEKYTKTRFLKISLLKRKSIGLGEKSEKKKIGSTNGTFPYTSCKQINGIRLFFLMLLQKFLAAVPACLTSEELWLQRP